MRIPLDRPPSAGSAQDGAVQIDGLFGDRGPGELRAARVRARPVPNAAAFAGLPATSLTAVGDRRARTRRRPRRRSAPAFPCTPSCTTSGMPPTSLATTAAPQAIASRLTMPSGSYTDGQTNTVEADSTCLTSVESKHAVEPEHPRSGSLQLGDGGLRLGGDLRGVRGARAEHELDARVEMVGRGDQVADALLPGDPADERGDRRVQVDALVDQQSRSLGRLVDLGVDAVADHVHLRRDPAPGSSPGCRRASRWTPR